MHLTYRSGRHDENNDVPVESFPFSTDDRLEDFTNFNQLNAAFVDLIKQLEYLDGFSESSHCVSCYLDLLTDASKV